MEICNFVMSEVAGWCYYFFITSLLRGVGVEFVRSVVCCANESGVGGGYIIAV